MDGDEFPESLEMEAEADSAEDFRDHLLGKSFVYDAEVLNETAVICVKDVGQSDDVLTFTAGRRRGWVVGATVANDSGDVVVFVRSGSGVGL